MVPQVASREAHQRNLRKEHWHLLGEDLRIGTHHTPSNLSLSRGRPSCYATIAITPRLESEIPHVLILIGAYLGNLICSENFRHTDNHRPGSNLKVAAVRM